MESLGQKWGSVNAGNLGKRPAARRRAGAVITLLVSCWVCGAVWSGQPPGDGDVGQQPRPQSPADTDGFTLHPPSDARPVLALDAPAAGGSVGGWIEWQRATEAGKEAWSARIFPCGDPSAALGLECSTAKPLKPNGNLNDLPGLLPALSWSQEVVRGVAVRGSVGQGLPTDWWASQDWKLQPSYTVGLKLAPEVVPGLLSSLDVTVNAEARPAADNPEATHWQVAPAVRLQSGANSWLSGGLLVPLDRGPAVPTSWQLNWSWQY